MSLVIDTLYVSYIAQYLTGFSRVNQNLWNFRCPVCLDSAKNKVKRRGYIYAKSQSLFFCCKNCDYSTTLGKLIEHVSPPLAADYRRDTFLESNDLPKRKVTDEALPSFKTNASERLAKTQKSRDDNMKQERLIDSLMDRIDTLPDDHEAVVYCRNRKIPDDQLHKLYFIPHICDVVQLSDKYKDRVTGKEPRIVLPTFNFNGQLTGLNCRAMRGEGLRYIAIKIKEDEPLIFGIEDIDYDKPIYVTEGAFDSLFIDNAIAVGGSSMGKIAQLGLKATSTVIVFDNQPREKQIVSLIDKNIKLGYNIVIWPDSFKPKDINQAIMDGYDIAEVQQIVMDNVYHGLYAQLKFNHWKKV